jgi:hypothetical protein
MFILGYDFFISVCIPVFSPIYALKGVLKNTLRLTGVFHLTKCLDFQIKFNAAFGH